MRLRILDLQLAQPTGAQAIEQLDEQGVLELFARAEPLALMNELRALGYTLNSSLRDDGLWLVRAGKGALPALEDLTELEAPEPMHRVLAAFSRLAPGGVFLALLPHRPVPLLPMLEARAARWEIALRPDGKAVLWLSR